MTKTRLYRRIVSKKRHTLGYVAAGGKFLSVQQATKAAQAGQLAGVRVVGNHIQAAIGARPLYALPETVKA